MMRWLMLVVVPSLFLAGCDVKDRPVPSINDPAGFRRILLDLSPWADGSPDRSVDGQTPGEVGSDRQLFGKWFMRYAEHQTYAQYDRNFRPVVVPDSVAAAIDEQRQYEADEAARNQARADATSRRQAAWEERQRVRSHQREMQSQAQDQRYADELAAGERRFVAEAARKTAERERENEALAAAHARQTAYNECRTTRDDAVMKAGVEAGRTGSDMAAVHALGNTFNCEALLETR